MPETWVCPECELGWNTASAADACEIRDLEDAKTARLDPPRRDPNIIRSIN